MLRKDVTTFGSRNFKRRSGWRLPEQILLRHLVDDNLFMRIFLHPHRRDHGEEKCLPAAGLVPESPIFLLRVAVFSIGIIIYFGEK